MLFGEKHIPHQWVKGQWEKQNRTYYLRVDTCSLCGCQRRVIQYFAKGDMQKEVSGYWRSKMNFAPDNKPQCWGAKNPQ